MSAYVDYLSKLECVRRLEERVLATTVGGYACREFLRRGWMAADGYLTHVMVPFLDSEEEVEVDVDEATGVYRYPSPSRRTRLVIQPLADITLYRWKINAWLHDLCGLLHMEPRQRSRQPTRIADHLWHMGEIRLAGTHTFAPLFVGRLWARASMPHVASVLGDPIWSRPGVLFVNRPSSTSLPREHAMRGLHEFVRHEDGQDIFDTPALDRVLHGFVNVAGEAEPTQFLRGNRLKLPHFSCSRELSPERAKLIKVLWGTEGKPPLELSWADVNLQAGTGYQSFDDAFGEERADFLEKPQRARYRLRRNP